MILSDDQQPATGGHRPTLDDLFRRAAVARPDHAALADAPGRSGFTDGPPRTFSFAEADRLIWAIAARLRALGLPTDAVVAVQLPNITESVLALLGILRAGMIAAPMPLLWRKAEMTAALAAIGAKVILTATRVDATAHCALAMQVAAEVFSIRHVCTFGSNCPDGAVPLDDLFDTDKAPLIAPLKRTGAGRHLAVVTWELGAAGNVAIARSHAELIAGGMAVQAEVRITENATLLSATPIASFAAFASVMMPWLMSGATLELHHGADPRAFLQQCRAKPRAALVLPGALADRLAQAGIVLAQAECVLALWRAPERMMGGAGFKSPARFVDICVFDETGLVAARRGTDGRPQALRAGKLAHHATDGAPLIETARTAAGTLAVRGAMVARAAFPPGAAPGDAAHFALSDDGFADTRYACTLSVDRQTLTVTAPPAGTVRVGGYAFARHILDRLPEGNAQLVAVPDALTGQRLVGSDGASATGQVEPREDPNPLLTRAFSMRKADAA